MGNDSFPARYFDASDPRPRTGAVRFVGGVLHFESAGARPIPIELESIRAVHDVSGEVHIELSGSEPDEPTHKLVVDDAEFRRHLDEVRVLMGSQATAAATWFGRLPVWGWLALAVIVIPLMYQLFTWGAEQAHVLIPIDTERALGDMLFDHLSGRWGAVDDPELQALLEAMVAELSAPDSPYDLRVSVLQSPDPNALALPGGRIIVLTGMLALCDSPDAVAGVLAHEIAHVEQRHGIRHLLRSLGVLYFATALVGGGLEQFETLEHVAELSGSLLVLRHSRNAEREADELAVARLHANERSVASMVELFRRMRQAHGGAELEEALAWISSHPLTSDRIDMLSEQQRSEDFQARPWLPSPEAWTRILERLEGA